MKKIIKNMEWKNKKEGRAAFVPELVSHGGVIRKDEIVAKGKGQELIELAEREAARIRAEANNLLQTTTAEVETAKKKGYEEGKQEAKASLIEEILKAKNLQEKFFKDCESQIMKLVLSIAEKVIGNLVEKETDAIQAIVRQALEHALGDRIVVRLHPNDFKRLKAEENYFRDLLERTRQLHFKEDETIQAGGCVVETEIGTIDAQLETQMKAIRKAFGV